MPFRGLFKLYLDLGFGAVGTRGAGSWTQAWQFMYIRVLYLSMNSSKHPHSFCWLMELWPRWKQSKVKCAKHQRVYNPRLWLRDHRRPGGGRDKFDWGPRQPEAGPGLKLVLSSDLLNIWMFHISKLKLIILIKLKSVSRTWRSAAAGRNMRLSSKYVWNK